jgi:hypothetical protein
MTNDLEFAIKQDIRNNPVVREVDLEQKREFLRILGWAALAMVVLIFALWPRASATNQGYQIQDLRRKLAQAQDDQRYYRLELSNELRPDQIRRRAINELNMIDPATDAVLPLELVPSHTPASRAIVASAAR